MGVKETGVATRVGDATAGDTEPVAPAADGGLELHAEVTITIAITTTDLLNSRYNVGALRRLPHLAEPAGWAWVGS